MIIISTQKTNDSAKNVIYTDFQELTDPIVQLCSPGPEILIQPDTGVVSLHSLTMAEPN